MFRESEVATLLQELQSQRAAGEPGVLRRRLRVLPNEAWQIKGDFAVDLVLLHVDRTSSFERLLPEALTCRRVTERWRPPSESCTVARAAPSPTSRRVAFQGRVLGFSRFLQASGAPGGP